MVFEIKIFINLLFKVNFKIIIEDLNGLINISDIVFACQNTCA